MIGYGTLPAQCLRGSMHRSELSGKRSANEGSCTPTYPPGKDHAYRLPSEIRDAMESLL